MVADLRDIKKTYKTIFMATEFEEPDSEKSTDIWNGTTKYVGNINVLGLLSSNSPELDTGPGILQMAIYTYALNERGEKKTKIFHVGINLYNTINKYSRVIGGYDDKVILDVEQILELKKDEVINNSNDDSAVDNWIEIDDDIHIDI